MIFEIPKDTEVLQIDITELKKQISSEAIDEFVKRLKSKCRKCYVDCDPYGSGIEEDSILYEEDIDEIAEELKAGEHNAKTKSES